LKQASRASFSRIESYFLREGFVRCPSEHTLFVKTHQECQGEGKILVVSLYVDNLVFTENDKEMFVDFKALMQWEFAMTDLGKMKFFLGVEVVQNDEGIFLS